MEDKQDNFNFSFSSIKKFDDHINTQIQGFDILYAMLVNYLDWFLYPDSNFYDIGASTGRFIKEVKSKYPDRNVRYYGIEINQNFLKDQVFTEDLNFVNMDISKDFAFSNACGIASIFTLQFIPKKHRAKIMRSIYDGLNKGGIFIWAEKTYFTNSEIGHIVDHEHHTSKLSRGITYEAIIQDEMSLRKQMQLNTTEENRDILRNAGFTKFETIWKVKNFECLIAIK